MPKGPVLFTGMGGGGGQFNFTPTYKNWGEALIAMLKGEHTTFLLARELEVLAILKGSK